MLRRRKLSIELLERRWLCDAAGIVNGAFDIADPLDPQFGWSVQGTAQVTNGAGVLTEQTRGISELIQAIMIPAGARQLTFTIDSLALSTNPLNPPDAFEVALLNADRTGSLVGVAQGLTQSDALLNVNAAGQVFFGSQVTVPGAAQSGGVASLTFPVIVTVALPNLAVDTAAVLYFDLFGAGAATAQVTLDDISLRGELLPSLSLSIDPTMDSGQVGDAYTRFAPVDLVGTTEPGQLVLLDTDGDGTADQQVTAASNGRFRFVSVALAVGVNTLEAAATNALGTSRLSREFVLDTQGIAGQLVVPAPGTISAEDFGYVEIQWTDAGTAGNHAASFDKSDVLVAGTTVDRVELLANGRVRYWYNDDGNSLPFGRIRVTQVAGAVTDRAGNGNAARVDEFARLTTACTWRNPLRENDVNNDGSVVPTDILVIVNGLIARGSRLLPAPVRIDELPPPFYDTNCDGFIAPQDILKVINYLNVHFFGEGEGSTHDLAAVRIIPLLFATSARSDAPESRGATASRWEAGQPAEASVNDAGRPPVSLPARLVDVVWQDPSSVESPASCPSDLESWLASFDSVVFRVPLLACPAV